MSAWRRLCLAGGRTGEILGMISVTDLTAGFDSLTVQLLVFSDGIGEGDFVGGRQTVIFVHWKGRSLNLT